jgi:hypothetical protein
MEILWFYIAVVLAISDEIHSKIFWSVFADFYILLAGILKEIFHSNITLWIVHEGMEAIFHFILLSLLFLSLEIGLLAALIHLLVDLLHEIFVSELNWLQHRALHFVIESLFFIIIFAISPPL